MLGRLSGGVVGVRGSCRGQPARAKHGGRQTAGCYPPVPITLLHQALSTCRPEPSTPSESFTPTTVRTGWCRPRAHACAAGRKNEPRTCTPSSVPPPGISCDASAVQRHSLSPQATSASCPASASVRGRAIGGPAPGALRRTEPWLAARFWAQRPLGCWGVAVVSEGCVACRPLLWSATHLPLPSRLRDEPGCQAGLVGACPLHPLWWHVLAQQRGWPAGKPQPDRGPGDAQRRPRRPRSPRAAPTPLPAPPPCRAQGVPAQGVGPLVLPLPRQRHVLAPGQRRHAVQRPEGQGQEQPALLRLHQLVRPPEPAVPLG